MTWSHPTVSYSSGRKQLEVQNRSVNGGVSPNSGSYAYTLNRTFPSGSTDTHESKNLADPNGDSKTWTYLVDSSTCGQSQQPACLSSKLLGLLATQKTISAGSGSVPSLVTPTWSLDSGGNPYVSSLSSCVYGTCAKSTQSLDSYGNTLNRQVFDYGNTSGTPDRTYTYTYPPSWVAQYATNHIYSSVVSAAVAAGSGSSITFLSNVYDNPTASALPSGASCP